MSNSKILTINNQPALLSVGNEYFIKMQTSDKTGYGDSSETSTTDKISSVFAGVFLDITPAISLNGRITLKLNPSTITDKLSEDVPLDGPSNLIRSQLSSVATVDSG